MDLEKLVRAAEVVSRSQAVLSARQTTYLRTYPTLLSLAKNKDTSPESRFLQVATAAYGWMPRIVRIDPDHLRSAIDSFEGAATVKGDEIDEALVRNLSNCLYSVVGASKVLHFSNPCVFPIWDSKVERVWNREASYQYMSKPQNYLDYAKQVHALRANQGFSDFFSAFNGAYQLRLDRCAIERYEISHVRAIESAAFELSGGEYEDA